MGGQAIFWETPTGRFYYETLPREEELYAGYVRDEYRLTTSILTLDAGLRVERKHITEGVDKSGPTQVTAAVIEDQRCRPTMSRPDWPDDSERHLGFSASRCSAPGRGRRWKPRWTTRIWQTRSNGGANSASAATPPPVQPQLTLFSYDIRNLKTVVACIGKGADAINVYDDLECCPPGAGKSV